MGETEKQKAIDELNRLKEVSHQMGGKDRIEKQHRRGRLTARERISLLFDPGSFVEMGILKHNTLPNQEGRITHINRISGLGKLDGRTAIVYADDATITGPGDRTGTGQRRGQNDRYYPENSHPIISLYDNGEDDVPPKIEALGSPIAVYPVRELYNSRKVPRVAAIMGNCLGTSCLQATMADFVVMVKGTSLAIFEPEVLGTAPEEKVTPEELGSWQFHSEITGQVDAVAEDEQQCLQLVREFLSYMPANCNEEPPIVPTEDPPDRKGDKLMRIIPDIPKRVYDMYQVIKTVVDDGKYFPIKSNFGKTIITCLARMDRRTVGFIANQTLHNAGAMGPDECDKVSEFIGLCDSFNIPLIFLSDNPGNLVGRPAEQKRIPTKILTWMQAIAFSTVPKICLVVRKGYGQGIGSMAAANAGADITTAFTTAEISFMSPQAAANVAYLNRIQSAEDPEAERAKLIDEMKYQNSPWPAAAVGLLDDVIDPRDARKYIIDCLNIMRESGRHFISEHRLQTWPTGF